jgi:hypothetical protein
MTPFSILRATFVTNFKSALMNTQSLILQLLIHDMKHEQLLAGLYRLGFESHLHNTDLSETVAALMGLSEDRMPQQWLDTYMAGLKKARNYRVTASGQNLLPLAESCYELLVHETSHVLPASKNMREKEKQ